MSSNPVSLANPSASGEPASLRAASENRPSTETAEVDRLERRMRDHLVAAIERTPLMTDPFPYVFIEGCFPTELYEELQAELPADAFYEPLIHKDSVRDDGTSPRIQASLVEDRLHLLPAGRQRDLWTAVTRATQDDRVKLALLRKLEPGIRERHSEPLEQIEAYSRPALNRDVTGYKILPHPDTKAKILSGLIYFPRSDAQRGLGTSLYVPTFKIPGLKPRFRLVKTVPFQANCGLVFAVTKRSFHGREPLPEGCGVRDYLALTYYNDPTRRGY
jgi:hypothetical protein